MLYKHSKLVNDEINCLGENVNIVEVVMASKDQVPFTKPVTVEEIDYKEIEILEVLSWKLFLPYV